MSSIKDVARRAGVAISTVSKALNGYPNVSEETRVKVNEAAKELNFTPNPIASALSSKKAGRVALLINLNTKTQAVDEIDMQYLSGAINGAVEKKLDVITVFFSMIRNWKAQEIADYFQSQGIEGIIIYGMGREDEVLHELIEEKYFKIVVVDVPIVNETTSSIQIDQEQAQYEVARKTVLENGGKSVLYLAGRPDGYVTQERLAGMQRFAREEKMPLLVRRGDFSEKKARELTFQYASDHDVIVCASDLMAIGAMRALQEMDIFRPVCGFDGITLMGYAGMQMNTVKQDFYRSSQKAMEEMGRLLAGSTGKRIMLDYQIVRMQYLDVIC
ncbi:MAG TPA: LacI family transcriptional regulator [Candidatus Eisenbergiella merdipullorum]|uniref:LacI family transcriptional regulator n=1 Tax=Candidatus Eisenbergiella merdipullorum TaxID=2838553 RepID=A0A9D2I4Q8_9FIRM|nr:LacI family transcriptional regulator [Candidatus Eisenbergiella merdipullorum]